MRPPGADGDGDSGGKPETAAAPRGRAGLGGPDLFPFFPGGGGGEIRPPGLDRDDDNGRPATTESDDPFSFTQ